MLVLAGTLDATIPVAHRRRLFQELHGCGEFVLVERAGHMVNVMHPREFSAAVLRLLDAVQRRDAAGEQRHGEPDRGPGRRA